VDIHFLNQD